jgi:sugar/nucleoside kinase (ribokinase family)
MVLAQHCQAIVVSRHERASCARLIDRATAARAVVAVTDGGRPNIIITPERGLELELAVPPLHVPVDDLGAGDVFAAAFFIALADHHDPLQAAGYANAAAAVRMSGHGPGAIGGEREIAARMGASELWSHC